MLAFHTRFTISKESGRVISVPNDGTFNRTFNHQQSMNQYFTRPDFCLMMHLEPTTTSGMHLYPDSTLFFFENVLMPLKAYINGREVLIVHVDTSASQETAAFVQEELAQQGVTCGAPTHVSAHRLAGNETVHELVATCLGTKVNSERLLILIVDKPAMLAFCGHDADSDTRYGVVSGKDVKIAGHPRSLP